MDLHKNTLQMVVRNGPTSRNGHGVSCVSKHVFLHLHDFGFDPILSNPYKTKAIVYAKIKTDKIDAAMPFCCCKNSTPWAWILPSCVESAEFHSFTRRRRYLLAAYASHRRTLH